MSPGTPSQWDGALGIENSPGGSLGPREIQMPGKKEHDDNKMKIIPSQMEV